MGIIKFRLYNGNYGIKFILDQIDTARSDKCFSNIKITHSVYYRYHINYSKDVFKSIPNYKKIISLLLSIQNDKDSLRKCGFWQNDINRSSNEFKNSLVDQSEEYLDYIKNEEESVMEKILSK